MSDLTFVTYEVGSTKQSTAFKRLVRSKAARSSAPVKPLDQDQHVRPSLPASCLTRRKKLVLDQGRLIRPTSFRSTGSVDDIASDSSVPSRTPSVRPDSEPTPSSEASSIPVEPVHPVLIIQPLLTEQFSPFLADYYLKYMAVDIPVLDLDRPGLLRSLWFPFAILHDGLLQIVFLLSGSCYANERWKVESQTDEVRLRLMSLKQQALANIRRMITELTSHDSDQLIAAVMKMASFEAMYGTQDAFAAHMSALRRLVNSRGGLSALGLDGLLERMVCWVDYNSACLLRTKIYFPEGNALPKPLAFDPSMFIGGSE